MLKKLFLCLALASLAACQGLIDNVLNSGGNQPAVVDSGPPNISGVASTTRADEALLYAAEAAYNVPAHAYVTANRAGQIPPGLKAQLKGYLTSAYEQLQNARRLYRLGNARDFRTAANAAIGLANSARRAMPAGVPTAQPTVPPSN